MPSQNWEISQFVINMYNSEIIISNGGTIVSRLIMIDLVQGEDNSMCQTRCGIFVNSR